MSSVAAQQAAVQRSTGRGERDTRASAGADGPGGDAASGRPLAISAALALLFTCLLALALHVLFGLGGSASDSLFSVWIYNAIMGASSLLCLARARRAPDGRAWFAVGVGLAVYSLGEIYWSADLASLANPPTPSWADAGYLGFYPPVYIGAALLIRSRSAHFPASTWLEGIVAALALASVAATILFDPSIVSTHGSFGVVATNLAFPALDVVLLALVAGGFVLMGRGAGRGWAILGLGLFAFGIGDSAYVYQLAAGSWVEDSWVSLTWPLSTAMLALAAWTRTPPAVAGETVTRTGRASHALTGLFAAMILGVLVMDAVEGVPLVAHILVILAILALFARIVLAGREQGLLAKTTAEARTDDLTGLPNRRSLYDATDRLLTDGSPIALLLLDLDRFKELNDTLGHNTGDELLRQVARRLAQALPRTAMLTRIGGDEFVILLWGEDVAGGSADVSLSVQIALEAPFPLDGLLIPVQASIGIAVSPEHASTRAELLRCADVAMYRAKSRQTGCESYLPEGDPNTRDALRLVSELRQALGHEQLVVYYQPKVSIGDGVIAGVEALVRWQHPRLGLLPPGDFIALAEREGLMKSLTLEVLGRSLAQQRGWREAGHAIPVAVNLSPGSLLDSRLPDEIERLLSLHGTPPSQLELEITEETLMRDPKRALDVIARISELGVGFSLDDFGTGYSSLSQLKRLPVHTLKIDRSFITHMTDNEDDANIVRSTIQLGHSLNLSVIAEGVESEDHLHDLQRYGCDIVQGYFLSRPIPPEQFTDWLGNHDPAEFRRTETVRSA